jgi:hypothetical protein
MLAYLGPKLRVQLRQQQRGSEVWWRLTEADGRLVCRWLPWEPMTGVLDKGGFSDREDAEAFRLGVNWERARAGLLQGVSTLDVDRERHELDRDTRGRPPKRQPEPILQFEVA